MSRIALACLFFMAVLSDVSMAQPCIPVPASGKIEKAGAYCLQRNLSIDRSIGIDISAAGVVLDLGKFEISRVEGAKSALSFGVKISGTEATRGIVVRNGSIRGFSIGLKSQGPSNVVIEDLRVLQSGAIGIDIDGNIARIRRNRIDGVGTSPLDVGEAYSVGANISGHDVLFEDNEIFEVYRQDKPRAVVGEAVGILIRSECSQCTIKNNEIINRRLGDGSIGIWNGAIGVTDIVSNNVRLFGRGVYAAGRNYSIRNNRVRCGDQYAAGVGVMLALRHPPGPDASAASFSNPVEDCLIDSFLCFSDCDIKLRELVKRLGGGADVPAPDRK